MRFWDCSSLPVAAGCGAMVRPHRILFWNSFNQYLPQICPWENIVVTVRGEGKTLIAFAVMASGAQIKDVDEYLISLPTRLPLPEYMRPSAIIEFEQFPITPNGNLDKAALSEMKIPFEAHDDGQEALSSLERDICLAWEKVLPNTFAQ